MRTQKVLFCYNSKNGRHPKFDKRWCGGSHMERGMEARRSRGFHQLFTGQSKENSQEEKSNQRKNKAPARAGQLGWE